MSRRRPVNVDWNLFTLQELERHLEDLKAVGLRPDSRFTAVLRRKHAEARQATEEENA